ncbi:MAG: deoxyribonuclease IV [Thermoplasmata archaeon]
MIIGGHMSISGGFSDAPRRAGEIGLNAMQIFTKNQRQWIAKPIDNDEAREFIKNSKKYGIIETVAHASYLINLATEDVEKFEKSISSMIHESQRSSMLGIRYLVFHPGAHMGKGESYGLRRIVEGIDRIIENLPPDVYVTIETTAGQGSNLGYKFEHISEILSRISDEKRVRVCIDTCHIFAAGYELRSREGYEKTMEEFENLVGFKYLSVIHLNDSEKQLGSRVDRHAQIGKGYIGEMGFKNILRDQRLENIPMILETPGGELLYPEDIKVIKKILEDDHND